MNCKKYQEDLLIKSANDPAARKSWQILEVLLSLHLLTHKFILNYKALIKNSKAMHCPQCDVVVSRKFDCDWVRCRMCDMRICWIAKKLVLPEVETTQGKTDSCCTVPYIYY